MLKLVNVNKQFKKGFSVKNINFEINKGEILAILGPNGAGKSTILKLIFNEYKLDNGQIIYLGDQNENYLQKFSFFTDQSLFPKGISLKFFCMYNAELAGIKPKEALKRTNHLLEILELTKYKNKNFNALSAGMQKKAMLAAALINEPECIFLDEPTANLDIESRRALIEFIKNMKNDNKTIVITSHILDELQNIIDRVIIIDEGEILYNEKFDKETQKLEEIYFSKIKNKNNVKSFNDLTNWK